MASDKLEQYLLLAKSTKGMAAIELINKVTETAGIYVYSEFLECPGIKELESNSSLSAHFRLLQLFAFGTYGDYINAQNQYPPLSEGQLRKLKQLTLLTMAAEKKRIPCAALQSSLGMDSLLQLEDLIIELIYADALRGKLDQRAATLEVEHALGRDIRPGQIHELGKTLSDWCDRCQTVLTQVAEEMLKANERKAVSEKNKIKIADEIENLKATIKTQMSQSQQMDVDDASHFDLVGVDGSPSSKSTPGTSQEKDKSRKMFKGLKTGKALFSSK